MTPATKQERETEDAAFLNVEKSVRGYRWTERLGAPDINAALAIAQSSGIPEILARILVARGTSQETLATDLEPTIRDLMPDPSMLMDMDAACKRFVRALQTGEKIAIFGDYDVDGATSSALLLRFLRAHSREALVYIPDRVLEGYGPSEQAFRQLIDQGATLIITVDCGTAAFEPLAFAKDEAIDVIVLDHHLAGDDLPAATALVNPNRQDDTSGQGYLAAVGVVFLFLVAVTRALRLDKKSDLKSDAFDLMNALDLVALGTVCDVVPLKGLNRAYVRRGLEIMALRQNAGLRVLADVAGINSMPNTYHLGYVLGPRLNAGGRIGRSDMAVELLTSNDDAKALMVAEALNDLNSERRAMQSSLQDEALSQVEQALDDQPEAAIAIAHGAGWHKGLIGLAASFVCEKTLLPSFVIAWEDENTGSGSARSIPGVDLGSVVGDAVNKGLLLKGGGHAMAAGFTVEKVKLQAFTEFLAQQLSGDVRSARSDRARKFDGALMASGVHLDLGHEIDRAGPFGAGNAQPRFAFPNHICRYAKTVGQNHVRCRLTGPQGASLDAIAFNAADTPLGELLLLNDGNPIHVSGHLRRSDWGGREKMELHIDDAAKPA